MANLHKPVYIPSIEGSDIYNYMFRGRDIDVKYIGMIPSSLELNKLTATGLKTFQKKTNDKYLSDDIINLKFKQKVDSGRQIIKRINEKITKLSEDKIDYRIKLEEFVNLIEDELKNKETKNKWLEVKQTELRKKLYAEGFEFNGVHYVVYKRSSAKSRVGQCLFIRKELYEPMIKWSRLGLEFRDRPATDKIDFPSLLAYESLVGSSLENIIHIKPENMLIVSDVESIFPRIANVVRTSENGYLDSYEEEAFIKNSLFDGEALLEESYFTDGKAMMLLRNHMFKSAAFNCKIQQFLRDECPEDTPFDEWRIKSMFEDEYIYAKDVHLITTPSSLKALKFSGLVGTEYDMWCHWKNLVHEDGCLFGVCKSEKPSKQGQNEHGELVQQTSYQMLNSLPLTVDDVQQFSTFEIDYIQKLKNDDNFFIQYLKETSNEMNSNNMYVSIYEINKDIVNTKLFRDFRKKTISSHVTHVKNGKVRLVGDYCVMLGNGIEFLYHAIGKLDMEKPESKSLQYNEVHCTRFDEVELTGFRNPHTSPNNVLLVKNKKFEMINKYFNLSDNVVCVNAINFPLQDILSGCDYDSDTVLLFHNDELLQITKSIFEKYHVCINQVKSDKKAYSVKSEDMAIIDNELSNSQKYIGRTVNIGQLCMSRYWDLRNNGSNDISALMKKIDVVTVLSGICIDLAKKMYDIDINKEIDHINSIEQLKGKDKPLFWKYVSQNPKALKTTKYDCPMDYLFCAMSNIEFADHREDIELAELLHAFKMSSANRKQQEKVFSYVESMQSKISNTYGSFSNEKERDRKIDDIIKYYSFFVAKLKITPETMYSLLIKSMKKQKSKISTRLLNTLFTTHKETFLLAFKQKSHTL